MPVTLNKSGDAHARSLIASGKVDRDSDWSFSAEDGNKLLGADGDDWANYAKWHLGEDTGEKDETKGRWKYPYGKSGKVYRRGVIAAESRAAAAGADTISAAAKSLLELIDKKSGKVDGRSEARRAPIGTIEHRAAELTPSSYDAKARNVRAILSIGSPVKRFYGTEVLKISNSAINLDRIASCGVPLIDSHSVFGLDNVLGRIDSAWIEKGGLHGQISFDDGEAGRKAEGLVARGMVRGISIGYRVDEWEITDEDGNVIDPEIQRMRFDENYTFTANRWELLEGSLVSVPADPGAFIRSANALADDLPLGGTIRVIKRPGGAMTFEFEPDGARAVGAAVARMKARQTMLNRRLVID